MAEVNKTTPSLFEAALLFLVQFDRFMADAEVYPDDLAEARRKLVEALND